MNAPYYTGGRQIGRTQKMLEAVLEQVGKVETIAVVCIDESSRQRLGKRFREMCLKHGHSVTGAHPPLAFEINLDSPNPTYVYLYTDESSKGLRGFDKVFADHAVYDFWLAPRYHWFDWMREGEETQ